MKNYIQIDRMQVAKLSRRAVWGVGGWNGSSCAGVGLLTILVGGGTVIWSLANAKLLM